MHPGFTTPLLDQFTRGDTSRDVRLLAVQCSFELRARDQLGLLLLLVDDPDPEVAAAVQSALEALDTPQLASFLARPDTPAEMRTFFAARGVHPGEPSTADENAPLVAIDQPAEEPAPGDQRVPIQNMSVPDRFKLAMNGTREQRSQLVRDPNKLVSTAVLSSPRITMSEIEAFARMGNVSEDVLRIIGNNRGWVKSYPVIAALVRNPKTPPGLSLSMVSRLNQRDLKQIAVDRNLPEAVRITARKYLATTRTE